MAGTSERMLRLLSLLQTHRFWSGSQLAERLEISERTLRRDVDRLRDLGYPVDAIRGHAGGYQLLAGAALPPLLVEDDEAVAIALALRTAAGGGVAGLEDSALRALTKVVSVMPPKLRRRMEAVASTSVQTVRRGPVIDAAALTTLARACQDHERVRFGYRGRQDTQLSSRFVEPHSVVNVGQRWPSTWTAPTGAPSGWIGSSSRNRRGCAARRAPCPMVWAPSNLCGAIRPVCRAGTRCGYGFAGMRRRWPAR